MPKEAEQTVIRKLLVLPPIVLGAAVLAFLIIQKQPPERAPVAERAQPVRTITAVATTLVPRIFGYGAVEPARVWSAIPEVAGAVTFVHPGLKKGAILPAGTEIVRIAPSDYELAIAQAEANIRSSEAKLKELTVSQTNTGQSLKIEERALTIRETELARKQQLLDRGTVAQSAVDQETRDTLTQAMRVQELRNSLRLIPTQQDVQREQIAIYEAQLEAAELDLARTRIALPFAARIAEKDLEVGQYVQAGQVLAVADDIATAEIEAQVSTDLFRGLIGAAAPDHAALELNAESFDRLVEVMGLQVQVRLAAGDGRTVWPGRFARTSDTIDPKTRTLGIIAAVDDPYKRVVPGSQPPLLKGFFVELELRARALEGRLLVPRAALHDGRLYIADAADRLAIRPVEAGLVQGDLIVIDAGLAPGERVVVSDLIPAIAGMLLSPQDDPALAERLAAEAAGGDAPR